MSLSVFSLRLFQIYIMHSAKQIMGILQINKILDKTVLNLYLNKDKVRLLKHAKNLDNSVASRYIVLYIGFTSMAKKTFAKCHKRTNVS